MNPCGKWMKFEVYIQQINTKFFPQKLQSFFTKNSVSNEKISVFKNNPKLVFSQQNQKPLSTRNYLQMMYIFTYQYLFLPKI